MATQEFTLTEDERSLINYAYDSGVFDIPGEWERFEQRVLTSRRREGAIKSALTDSSLGARLSREIRGIETGFADPHIGVDAAIEHFEEKGLVGGLADIAASAITTPFRALGTLGGGSFGERPLETLIGVASIVPVGRLVGAGLGRTLASSGAKRLGSRAARGTLLDTARAAAIKEARAARAGGASAAEELTAGLKAANKVVTDANPSAAGRLRAGQNITRATSSPKWRNIARGVEAGDITTGIEEWPLEAIGEGLLDIGATALSHSSLRDAILNDDLSADGPPPDVPPRAQLGLPTPDETIPQGATRPDVPPVDDTQPVDTPSLDTPPSVVPNIITPLWQTPDGQVIAPKSPNSKETVENTRKWSFGNPSDPQTVGTMTVKRVPSPEGTLDNRHWQATFEGGGVEGITEEAPIMFGADDGIGSYNAARDAALAQIGGTAESTQAKQPSENETHAESRARREAQAAENREARLAQTQSEQETQQDDANKIPDERDVSTVKTESTTIEPDGASETLPQTKEPSTTDAQTQETLQETSSEEIEEIEETPDENIEVSEGDETRESAAGVEQTPDETPETSESVAPVEEVGETAETEELTPQEVPDGTETGPVEGDIQTESAETPDTDETDSGAEEITPLTEEAEQTDSETGETTTLAEDVEQISNELPEFKRLKSAIVRYLSKDRNTFLYQALTAEKLFEAATKVYGGDAYDSQQIYDILESAGNLVLYQQGLLDVNVDVEQAMDNIEAIQEFEARLPRQADRTTERIENQQYSTPYHYAYLINWVANLESTDVVLEPSAGTGNIAWAAKALGAEVHVNDIGKFRKRILADEFENTTGVDATQIDVRLPGVKPTLVLMNPPFSSTQRQQKSQQLGVRMVESALKSLQPGGRLVAIVGGGRDLLPEMISGEKPGGGPNFEAQGYRKFWARIAKAYNIRANVHVNGAVYKGFGTNFNTRLLVIDKPLSDGAVDTLRDSQGNLKAEYDAMQKQRVDSVVDAVTLMEAIRNERTDTTEQQRSEPAGETPVDETTREQSVLPDQPETGTTDIGRTDAKESGDVPVETPGVVPDGATEPIGQPDERADVDGQSAGAAEPEPETSVEMVTEPGAGDGESDGEDVLDDAGPGDGSVGSVRPPEDTVVRRDAGSGGDDVSPQSTDTAGTDIAKSWIPIKESHIVKGRRVKLQETASLAAVVSPGTDNIEVKIPEPAKSIYSEAQLQVIKLMIRAHQSHIEPEILGDTPPLQAFYDGNDPGVGKSLEGIGLIQHNWAEGRRKHVWLTATQNLVDDFKGAYVLGGGQANQIKNMPDAQGKMSGEGVLPMTYSALAGKNMEPTRIGQILEWLVGAKPPDSLLHPQTDQELLHFGDLPRTFALAYTQAQAGEEYPKVVRDLIAKLKQSYGNEAGVHRINEYWDEQYESILKLSDAIRSVEGGISPAEWVAKAKAFEGVIVFDESHKMKFSEGTKGRKPSATGVRGRQLQRLLPNARIVYMSATGTTSIDNMAYMERLGIWGRNKPFANSEHFISEMEKGGLASQEVVVRDLKAKGLFISRSLDFSDVVVRSIVHPLTEEQERIYNEMANVWQQVRLNMFKYADRIKDQADQEDSSGAGNIVGGMWSDFYSRQQRFFGAMLDSLKMQSVIPDMIAQLDAGKKVTVQIVNTYEAGQKRQLERAARHNTDINDLEFTAREMLEDYLDEDTGLFPSLVYESIFDAATEENKLRVMKDADGRPVRDPEMEAKRQELEALLFRSFLPQSPLDQFVQMFKDRGLEIAEVTNRKTRYYRDRNGERVQEKLSKKQQQSDIKRFNENELFGLAFSKAGGTGANYPSTDEKHPIVQYVIQVGWQADDFKQGSARSKRADEVVPPELVMTSTDMVGERRFLSTAAGRAAEMGATTRSQATGGTGLDLFDFDTKYIESEYGVSALYDFLYAMMSDNYTFPVPGETNEQGNPLVIGWYASEDGSVTSFHEITGINVESEHGIPDRKNMPPVKQFMNRVLGAPSKVIQNALYYQFFDRLSDKLERAKAENLLDTGVETLRTNAAKIIENKVIYTDTDSGAKTYATDIEIQEASDRTAWDQVRGKLIDERDRLQMGWAGYSFYINADNKLFFDKASGTSNADGNIVQNIRRESPSGSIRYIRENVAYPEGEGTRHKLVDILFALREQEGYKEGDAENAIQALIDDDLAPQWRGEYETYPAEQTNYVRMVQGLMTDVWNKINPPISDKEIVTYRDEERVREEIAKRKLIRIHLDDGSDVIGRRFLEISEYKDMLERFGQGTDDVQAYSVRISANLTRVRDMLTQENYTIQTETGLSLKQRTSQGRQYVSVEGDTNVLNQLATDGIVEKFRPGGGRFVFELKSGNTGTFFASHKPTLAIKGQNRQEIDYTTTEGAPPNVSPETPTPEPKDSSGGGLYDTQRTEEGAGIQDASNVGESVRDDAQPSKVARVKQIRKANPKMSLREGIEQANAEQQPAPERVEFEPVEMDSTGIPILMDTELRQAIYNKATLQFHEKSGGNLPNAAQFVQMVFDIEEAFDSNKMDSWTDTQMKRRKVYNAIAKVLDEKYSDLQIEAQAILEVIMEHETPTPESTPEPTPTKGLSVKDQLIQNIKPIEETPTDKTVQKSVVARAESNNPNATQEVDTAPNQSALDARNKQKEIEAQAEAQEVPDGAETGPDDPVLAEYAVLKELGEDKLNTNTNFRDKNIFLVDRGYGKEQSGIIFRVRKIDPKDTKSDWSITVIDTSDINDQKAITVIAVNRAGGIRPKQQVVKTPKDAVLKMLQQREARAGTEQETETPESTLTKAVDDLQTQVESEVGESATIKRSGDDGFQQITVTPQQSTPPEETPIALPGETPITETGEINFVEAEFYPILNKGEPETAKGYLAENTGIDFAQLIVHRHIGKADKGEEAPDVWIVSDYETGASLPSNVVSGKSRKEAIDQAIPYLKEVGAAQFKRFADKIKRTQVDWYKKVAALRTPEGITNEQIETYLDQLGIIGYSGDTFRKIHASQITSITQVLYSNMIEKSGDNSLTSEQTEALNALQALATPHPVSGGAPIVRPLETIVDVPDLSPGTSTSTKVRLLEKLISKLPMPQELQAKVDGVLPDILRKRKQARYLYLSGYKKLLQLNPELAEAMRKGAEHMVDIYDRGSANDLLDLAPHAKALTKLVKERQGPGESHDTAFQQAAEPIFRFIEDNTPIEDDPELLEIAQGWKEARRKQLKWHNAISLQVRDEIESLDGDERLVIFSSDGKVARDMSPQLVGHEWIDDKKMFKRDKDKAMLTPEQAVDETDKLHMPHIYPKSHWNTILDQIDKGIIKKLDAAAKRKGVEMPGFTHDGDKTWTFDRTGEKFTDKGAAVTAAKQYWTEQQALAQNRLAGGDSDIIGRYGPFEVARETTDKLYNRDVTVLLEVSKLFFQRIGEIAVWGQYDPILGKYPRLAKYIARIAETPADARETAIKAVAETLMGHESGMYERLPEFKEGSAQAQKIMRYWNTPDVEKMREDRPELWTDEVLQTLVRIGIITAQSDGSYAIRGKTDAARRTTFANHLVPYFKALYIKEESVLKVIEGLGNWRKQDESSDDSVVRGINNLTTIMSLGLRASVQNIAEIPLAMALTGSKSFIAGTKRLAADKEFREMLPRLGGSLQHARDYMQDTNLQGKYLGFILFSASDKQSRLVGSAVGWETAKDAISDYIASPTINNTKRLEELQISVATIDEYRYGLEHEFTSDFDALVAEAEGRVLEGVMMIGGLRKPDAPAASDRYVDMIGDEMARSARYVSSQILKRYDALSLPGFLAERNPMIRTFFKFKSWSAQMHRFMMDRFIYAGKELKQGNTGPAWRLMQGLVGLGISTALMMALFAALSGRERDEDANRLLETVARMEALGVGSMVIELAMYADGNPYKAGQAINSAFGSPTVGIAARVGRNIITRKPGAAAADVFWQLPGAREARQFGTGPLRRIQGE